MRVRVRVRVRVRIWGRVRVRVKVSVFCKVLVENMIRVMFIVGLGLGDLS